HCLAFTPDGKSVVIGGAEGDVCFFDLASGKESRRFVGHDPSAEDEGGVWGAIFTPDGRTLIIWDSEGIVRFWDARSGKALRRLDGEGWRVCGLSPDGKLLAVTEGRTSTALRLLDVATGGEVRRLDHPLGGLCAAFSPDGKTVAVASLVDGRANPI